MKWFNKALPALLLSCLFLLILAQPACARALLGVSFSQGTGQTSVQNRDLSKQIDRAFGDNVAVHSYSSKATLLSMLMQFNKLDAALISQETYDQQPKGSLIALAKLQISNESEQAQMVLAARANLSSSLREQLVQGYQELLLSTNGLDHLEQYATSTEAPISELISKQYPDPKKKKPEDSASKPVVAKSIFSSIGEWLSPSETTQKPDAKLAGQTKQASGTQAVLSAGASPSAAPKKNTPEITATETKLEDSEKIVEKAFEEVDTLTAASSPEKKQDKLWGPHLDIISKLGNERVLGEASLFVPILQGADRMLFTDLRFQIDDNNAQEGNLGLGYRQIIKDLILGGYIYHDKRETRHNNSFRQWTFGLEALSVNYDTRFNVYLADEDTEEIAGTRGDSGLFYSGNNLLYNTSFEKSLSGFDFELGGLISTPYHPELRAYLGGYHFSASGVDDITGPKARLEVRFPNMFDWDKSFFELGGEISNDDTRGTDYYVTGRLHIPFGKKLVSQPKPTMTTLEKRMTERVVRDPDIVTARENKTGPLTFNSEALEFTHINSAGAGGQGTFESPYGTLTEAAGAPTEMVLMHADSVFNNENLSLSANQRLLGDFDGARYLVETDQMGTVPLPRFSTGLSAPVIQNASSYAVSSADNTEISGLTALNSGVGILANGLRGQVDIRNVDLNGNNYGVHINNSAGTINLDSVRVADSTSSNLSVTGGSAAVNIFNNSSLTQNSSGALVVVAGGHTGTIDFSADTTSTANSGAGFQFDNADGSYSFRNAISLDGTSNSIDIVNGTDGDITFYSPVTISNPQGSGIVVTNSTGNVNFSGPTIINTTSGDGININASSGSYTFNGLDITTQNGSGLLANTAGLVSVTGTGNTIDATGGTALGIDAATIDMTFDNLASTNSTSEGVSLDNVTGAGASNGLQVAGSTSVANSAATGIAIQETAADIAFGDLTVATTGADGLALNFNQTGNFSAGTTTISDTVGDGVSVTNHQGNAAFGDTTVTNAGNDGILIANNAASSNLVFNSANINNAARGLAVSNNAGALVINGGAIGATTPTTAESVLIDGGNGNLNIATDIVNTTANSIAISNRTGGTVTLSGNINDTGLGINASNNTGGVVNFSGSDKTLNTGANDAVTLVNNSGATINFTNGGLAINTTGGSGFNVANGGTINVNGTGNSITTDTGSALTLSNTTIGTDGIAFEAITTGTLSGISALDIDNVSGGLLYGGDVAVAGTNLADAISVTNSAAMFAINSLDLDNIDGTGVYLNNSGPVSINGGTIYNTAGSGIEAVNTSFDIDNVTIDSTGLGGAGVSIVANDANSSLNFSISNSSIVNTDLSGLQVNASNSSQIDTMEITGTSFIDNEFHAIDVLAKGGASINNLIIGDPDEVNPGDVTIRNNGTEAIFIVAGDDSTSTGNTGSVDVKINAIDIIDINNNSSDTNINVEAQGNGSVTFSLSRSQLDKAETLFSIDNILLVTKQFEDSDKPTIEAYITDNDLKNESVAGLTARNSSVAGSLNLYLLNNKTDLVSGPSYGFTLDNETTGLMTLYSRDGIVDNGPTFGQLEDLLRSQGNTDGSDGILNPAGETSTIIIAPLP
jgi:hypothetical protein